MDDVKQYFGNLISYHQIKTLLWKDYLVRIRQPWMTLIQFVWPLGLFLILYTLKLRFDFEDIGACQFPTRPLPKKENVLPFFQSYICTIDNQCRNPDIYEETTPFSEAPVTPIVNIVQTFLNEHTLFDAIMGLPVSMNFLGLITTIATSPKFHYLEENINVIRNKIPEYAEKIGFSFDAEKVWSDDSTFKKFGTLLCGKPFAFALPAIPFVEKIFRQEDYNGPDKSELDAMPTPYCKQLYLDVTRSISGKMTWTQVKPIIQGKMVYGPNNADTNQIVTFANSTFEGLARFKTFVGGLSTIVGMLHTNEAFRSKLVSLVDLAKTPLIQGIIGSIGVDTSIIDSIYDALTKDETLPGILTAIGNIMDCFSVDRYIPVESEKELTDIANELNKKKLFYSGIYFNNENITQSKDVSYTLRMEIDNTAKTIENRHKFWFPGPNANFIDSMRYHRGFLQTQVAIDFGIIKRFKELQRLKSQNEAKISMPIDDVGFETTASLDDNMTSATSTTTASPLLASLFENFGSFNATESDLKPELEPGVEDFLSFDDEAISNTTTESPGREKRSPQFEGLLGMLFSGGSDSKSSEETSDEQQVYDVDQLNVYTKMFPYPSYRRDDFKQALYLGQLVQLFYYFALIVQIASAVRQRVWMRESGNLRLMQAMGLNKSSETISWSITVMLELMIIFFICSLISYIGGTLETTGKLFLTFFLFLYSISVLAFCYMMSALFSSASLGSVSAVIVFLMTFMPYIIIVLMGDTLYFGIKYIANLCASTAFCYVWRDIIRIELQQKPLSFTSAFDGSLETGDIKLGLAMICFDTILYTFIGFFYGRYMYNQYEFCEVAVKDMDSSIGAVMSKVVKNYGAAKPAINNVSIIFRREYITCLLGRNGAGKSTIIKMLTGEIRQTSGTVYLPQNLNRITGDEHKEKVGLCPQNTVLIPNLTAKEHLQLYASIKLNDRNAVKNVEVERIMRSLDFGKYENFNSEHLSGGFKRRLNIGIAFIGSPNLVILDEPCSAVDTKARKQIWETISTLRKGRAVVLATHYLDEAEHLSDNILILNEGQVVDEHNPESLKQQFTKSFDINIKLSDSTDRQITVDELKKYVDDFAPGCTIWDVSAYVFNVTVPYYDSNLAYINFEPLIKAIENLQRQKRILSFNVISKDLEGIFNNLIKPNVDESNNELMKISYTANGNENGTPKVSINSNGDADKIEISSSERSKKLTETMVIQILLWKRFVHFKRNYRSILSILLLPTLFVTLAMLFVTIRPPGEFDKELNITTALYPNSAEFLSFEHTNEFDRRIKKNLHCSPGSIECEHFNTSENVFRWILSTSDKYLDNRYGGVSINDTIAAIWYNNNGYHSMPAFLNKLSTALFNAELNSSGYSINTINSPLIMARKELSISSIMQQISDAGVSLILLLALSLVIAGSSVYLVNERLNGEKLQQKLCGVSFKTYWGVSFVWDLLIYCIALAGTIIMIVIFDIPAYTARDNLAGVWLLMFLFGFATIPMVHLFEKLFSDASLANMHLLCLNVIVALTFRTVIILFELLAVSQTTIELGEILNKIFLCLPQHALADGFLEIAKNYIVAAVFERFGIDTYRSPVDSTLLMPHCISLVLCGIVFAALNYLTESGRLQLWKNKLQLLIRGQRNEFHTITPLQNVVRKDDKYDMYCQEYVLKVENLCKTYKGNHEAISNVSFHVNSGECFGLLGANGAGKSTVFSILSGQLYQTTGIVEFFDDRGISYCPQTNALDHLLTVKEVIRFYGTLRQIKDLEGLTRRTLRQFHLEQYQNILVKNLSGGNRRKLSVAVTCFGDTSLVLMDEPTSDMDPITRSLVYKSINELISDRRSVILTSHTITEIDRVCHRIGVLRQGRMISMGPPSALKTLYGNSYVVTIFYDDIESLTIERDLKKVLPALENLVIHNHCLQFTIRIKVIRFDTSNNEILLEDEGGIALSDLFNKLHLFAKERGVVYTISECLLDQAFERVLETNQSNYTFTNTAFTLTETTT